MKITKAVIPAAGLGTRFLPYTKVIPKELVPILGVPSIQIIIEEGIASSITDFVIIANEDKHAIQEHFSPQPHLEAILTKKGKSDLLKSINEIIETATFTFVPQENPLGLGHAILVAKNAIGNHYFGVILPDDLMICGTPALQQMIVCAQKYNASVVGVQEVPQDKVSSYGIVAPTKQVGNGVFEIDNLIEKPRPEVAPSNLAIVGRYVLSPRIFDSLETIVPGAGGEYQLTDAITDMMKKGERIIACIIKGTRHDVGNPLGWLEANIDYALRNPFYAEKIRNFCRERL